MAEVSYDIADEVEALILDALFDGADDCSAADLDRLREEHGDALSQEALVILAMMNV